MWYFTALCFFWAFVGIASRIAMAIMGKNWAIWEQKSAYKETRPMWVVIVSVVGLCIIVLTWFLYIYFKIPYGWILGTFVSITGIKIGTLLFSYDKFLQFLTHTLRNKKRLALINTLVLLLSFMLIAMGLWLY